MMASIASDSTISKWGLRTTGLDIHDSKMSGMVTTSEEFPEGGLMTIGAIIW